MKRIRDVEFWPPYTVQTYTHVICTHIHMNMYTYYLKIKFRVTRWLEKLF